MANKVTVARVYVTEGDKLLKAIMSYLHDAVKVQGVTVFRAVSGFGKSGVMHSSDILTMSLDLPLIVEFFDKPEIVEKAIERLAEMTGEGHIVFWDAYNL